MLTLDEAIQQLRSDPQYRNLVRDAYLGADVIDSRQRFAASGEFKAVQDLLGDKISGSRVLDIGAGVGIASAAFITHGAATVYALEPDRSDLVGLGTMTDLAKASSVHLLEGFAEQIPLGNETIDIVYTRQVLHHTSDLNAALRESARVLRRGGVFLACREHVIKDEHDLEKFLEGHVVHQLAGGENAYTLEEYEQAILQADLTELQTWRTFESVINYFPQTYDDAMRQKQKLIRKQYRLFGRILLKFPIIRQLATQHLQTHYPGNMFTFMAKKP